MHTESSLLHVTSNDPWVLPYIIVRVQHQPTCAHWRSGSAVDPAFDRALLRRLTMAMSLDTAEAWSEAFIVLNIDGAAAHLHLDVAASRRGSARNTSARDAEVTGKAATSSASAASVQSVSKPECKIITHHYDCGDIYNGASAPIPHRFMCARACQAGL